MSGRLRAFAALVALAASGFALAGCSYDYLQRTDQVSYSAGDAVRANLEAQTINPERPSIYSTKGLGRNGVVIPSSAGGGSATPSAASGSSASASAAP